MSKLVSSDPCVGATGGLSMKLHYRFQENSGTIDELSESVILDFFGRLRDDSFLILDTANGEFVQTTRGRQDSYVVEYLSNGVQFTSDPQPVSRASAENLFIAYLLYGPNSKEFQTNLAWVKLDIEPEPVSNNGVKDLGKKSKKSKRVSEAAQFKLAARAPMRLQYCFEPSSGTVDAPSESVIHEYFSTLSETDFLMLENADGEFIQTCLASQDLNLLEYQANGIQFIASPQPATRKLAESAFIAFLRYGPNSIQFQSNTTWVKSDRQPKPAIGLPTLADGSMPWKFGSTFNEPDTDPWERSTMAESALPVISKNRRNKSKTLHLTCLNLTSIPPQVSQLVWLQSLYLWGNEDLGKDVKDFDPLTNLMNLRTLHLGGTQVSDIAPLVGLMNLRDLDISHTQVSDLTPLTGLVNLRTLDISNTQVSNLKPLAGLVNLQSLNITDTLVNDLTPVAGLVGLRTLTVSDKPPVSDLVVNNWSFEQQPAPAIAASTPVGDLSPLADLLNLETLNISGTPVRDLTPLAGLLRLEELDISGTQVSNLAPLTGLVRLNTLDVSRTQVIDLTPLASLANLCRFTPSVGVDEVPRQQYRCLEAMADVARMSEEKGLAQIAKERFQKPIELRVMLASALRLLQDHDPYPRNSPLWEHDGGRLWPGRLNQNAELVLNKVDLVYKVLAASSRWKKLPREAKLQLQMGDDLPLPDYLLDRLSRLNLTLVRDLIATPPRVLKLNDFDTDDVRLLKCYFDWYGVEFDRFLPFEKISNELSVQPISELEMTVRATNCLLAKDIYTVGDLVNFSVNDLLKLPNLGRKAINEIKETLASRGLMLAGE